MEFNHVSVLLNEWLEGLNIKDHMKDYELSSDAANSLIEISYLSSYGPEDAKNFAYKSMYTRYS